MRCVRPSPHGVIPQEYSERPVNGPGQPIKLIGDDAAYPRRSHPLLLPGKIACILLFQRCGQAFPAGAAVIQPRQGFRRDVILFSVS